MYALSELFDQYSKLNPPPPYWLNGDDSCEDYCLEHAKQKAAEAGCEIDGGFHREMDSCCHCAVCGKLLDYTLTDYGQDTELEHFRSVRFRRDRPLDRETSFHLARALYGRDGDLAAIEIAARAIRCMKYIPKMGT